MQGVGVWHLSAGKHATSAAEIHSSAGPNVKGVTMSREESVEESVVLLNEAGEPIGTHPKASVHTDQTPLHLAFSCYLFNSSGELLLTRRALTKTAWPGVWTNSFCGHPGPGETTEEAVHRRAQKELGLSIEGLQTAIPDFRYRAVDASGIVENEICPVFTAQTDYDPSPAAEEVCEWFFAPWSEVLSAVTSLPRAFSPWMVRQVDILDAQFAGSESGARL